MKKLSKTTKAAAREERLSANLRANLRRRKAQIKSRSDEGEPQSEQNSSSTK